MTAYVQRSLLALTLAAPLLASGLLAAQSPGPATTQGFNLGLRTAGIGVAFKGGRDGTGGGLGLRLGYGFNERFSAFVGFDGGSISEGDGFVGLPDGDDYGAVVLELGGRMHFRTQARWVPFAEAAVAVIGLGFDDDDGREVGYGGPSGSVGAGVLFHATRVMAIEAGAAFTAGELQSREIDGVEDDVDIGASAVRIHIGISLYPFR